MVHPFPIELIETADGVLLPLAAQPRARKSAISGAHAGRLKVTVTEVPEKDKANAALLKLLADKLNLKRSQLQLVAGATSREKKLLVTGVTLADLRRRLAGCLGGER